MRTFLEQNPHPVFESEMSTDPACQCDWEPADARRKHSGFAGWDTSGVEGELGFYFDGGICIYFYF